MTIGPSERPVAVLAGGLSSERDVSLQSGRRVLQALREAGQEAHLLDVDGGLLDALAADPPYAVISMVHGAAGEDGSLVEILDAFGVPYVGSSPAGSRFAFDKPTAKSLVTAAGIRTPASAALSQTAFRDLGAAAVLDAVVSRLGLPLMIKPTRGGSSLGASIVHDRDELPAAMVGVFSYGPTALLESYVVGTEVTVGVLDEGEGAFALPVVEVRAEGFYDYTARYTAGTTEFVVPADLPDEQLARCEQTAVAVHESLGLRDFSRIDLLVDPAGELWFLEANVAPGMTETSTYPLALAADSRDLGQTMLTLAHRAAARCAAAVPAEVA